MSINTNQNYPGIYAHVYAKYVYVYLHMKVYLIPHPALTCLPGGSSAGDPLSAAECDRLKLDRLGLICAFADPSHPTSPPPPCFSGVETQGSALRVQRMMVLLFRNLGKHPGYRITFGPGTQVMREPTLLSIASTHHPCFLGHIVIFECVFWVVCFTNHSKHPSK